MQAVKNEIHQSWFGCWNWTVSVQPLPLQLREKMCGRDLLSCYATQWPRLNPIKSSWTHEEGLDLKDQEVHFGTKFEFCFCVVLARVTVGSATPATNHVARYRTMWDLDGCTVGLYPESRCCSQEPIDLRFEWTKLSLGESENHSWYDLAEN